MAVHIGLRVPDQAFFMLALKTCAINLEELIVVHAWGQPSKRQAASLRSCQRCIRGRLCRALGPRNFVRALTKSSGYQKRRNNTAPLENSHIAHFLGGGGSP